MVKFYLFYEFLKIGIFAIGGGYAALPFLYHIQKQYGWFSVEELTNMIAVSNITPGPIGINMATYTGFTTAGILGSLIATTSIVLGPFVFVILLMKLLNKFKTCNWINGVFLGLRPASCALLTSIGLTLLYSTAVQDVSKYLFDYKALILFFVLLIPFLFIKKNPLLVIIAGALGGIIIQSF